MGLENPVHILIILLVVLLVFGPKRLPGIGRSIGSGLREFRGSLTKMVDGDDEPAPAPKAVERAQAPSAPAQPAAAAPVAEPAPAERPSAQ